MSEPLKTLTGAQLMAMEQQYAQGFIGGQWTHRVVPQLFMAVRESFATIDTLTTQLTEMTMERGLERAGRSGSRLRATAYEEMYRDTMDRALAAEQRVKELEGKVDESAALAMRWQAKYSECVHNAAEGWDAKRVADATVARYREVVGAGKWLLMDVTPMEGDLCKTCRAHDPDHADDCTFTEFRDALAASLPTPQRKDTE